MDFETIEENIIYNFLTDENKECNNSELQKLDKESQYVQEITNHIISMDKNRENYAYRNLSSSNRLKKFVKKAIRKMLKWYIEPICFQQTDFNNAATSCIGRLTELHVNNLKKQNQLVEENKSLENNINQLVEKNKSLENKLYDTESTQFILNEKVCNIIEKLEMLEKLDLKVFEKEDNFFNKTSTSQSGEDTIVSYILYVLGLAFSECTYLDLGANHAKELSNTYYFYKHGARGVLVEANPKLIPELKFFRHGDIILNYCLVENQTLETIDFYLIDNGDGLSSPFKENVEQCLKKNQNLKMGDTVKVKTITLKQILDKYFDKAPTILNIDIEGSEFNILKTIDFNAWRPLIIIVEMIPYQLGLVTENKNKEILEFMKKNNYTEYAFTGINSIFLDKGQI